MFDLGKLVTYLSLKVQICCSTVTN